MHNFHNAVLFIYVSLIPTWSLAHSSYLYPSDLGIYFSEIKYCPLKKYCWTSMNPEAQREAASQITQLTNDSAYTRIQIPYP